MMAHLSSRAPAGYMPPETRIDFAMRPGAFDPSAHQPFTPLHLQYMQCGGASIFKEPLSYGFFYNALRMTWKVAGRVLRTYTEHRAAVFNFLSLEWQGQFVIMELLTDVASCYLLQQEGPAFDILTTVIEDLYESQWVHWTELNRRKSATHAQMVIYHAQNTSNQLSNFVLAFDNRKADPALKAWAQHTATQHLIQIVSPGHLPLEQGTNHNAMLSDEPSTITLNPVAPATEFLNLDDGHPRNTTTVAGPSHNTRMAPPAISSSHNKRKAPEPTTGPNFPHKRLRGTPANDNIRANGSTSGIQRPATEPSRVFGGRDNPYGPFTAGRDVYIIIENGDPIQNNHDPQDSHGHNHNDNQSQNQNYNQNNNTTGRAISGTNDSSLDTGDGQGHTRTRTGESEDGEVTE